MTRKTPSLILVHVSEKLPRHPTRPLGHASIAASVLSHGGIHLVDEMCEVSTAPQLQAARLAAIVRRSRGPTWIGIGVFVFNEHWVRLLCQSLKTLAPGVPIVLGGPSVSFTGAGQLENLFPDADYFIRGQAEAALVSLITGSSPRASPGVHEAGSPDQGTFAAPDITALPSPFLSARPPPMGPTGFVWWETKRGCPFRCAFCQHFDASGRPPCLEIGLERLHREILRFSELGVRDIKIIDPVFNMPGTHYPEVLRSLARLDTLDRLCLEARFEFVTEEFASLAGALGANPEFGLQTIIPEEEAAIRRRNDKGRILAAADLLHRHGVDFSVSAIYGLPGQTPDSFDVTLRFARSLCPREILAFPLGLYRGSELERQRDRWGFEICDGPLPLVVASNSFSREEYARMATRAKAAEEEPDPIAHPRVASAKGRQPARLTFDECPFASEI